MARFIASSSAIKKQIKTLKGLFDRVSYSYKTNPEIGNWIAENTDLPISANSVGTFENLRKISKRLVYFIQGETRDEIEQIVDAGVKEFVVDNENDMNKLLDVSENIHLFLRAKIREHTVYTGKYFVYGFDHTQLKDLVKKSPAEKTSIHFHKKTQNLSEWYLKEEFSDISSIFDRIEYLNIGGGLPWDYHSSHPNFKFIESKIDEFKEWMNEFNVKLMAEPGRFIAAPAVKLEAVVRNIYGRNVILDCSVFNAYMDTFLFNIRLQVEGEGKGNDYILKGSTPDSLDIFRYSVKLPELKAGDKIIFLNAGAYNFHTDFNNLEKIPYSWED